MTSSELTKMGFLTKIFCCCLVDEEKHSSSACTENTQLKSTGGKRENLALIDAASSFFSDDLGLMKLLQIGLSL